MRSLLHSPPFARFLCVQMWGPGVLPTALPALLSTTLSPALSVYLHKCRVAGSASARTACAICPTLRQSQSPPQPHESSPPRCPSLALLPIWMNVYFLFLWCQSPLLFDSLSVLVVRGGAVCLPTPPSWFSPMHMFFGFSISYTVLNLPLSILYPPIMLLIPCTFSLILLFPPPS